MLNFDFHNPTHIAFGKGRVAELAKLVPAAARISARPTPTKPLAAISRSPQRRMWCLTRGCCSVVTGALCRH